MDTDALQGMAAVVPFLLWPPLLDASSALPLVLARDEMAQGCPRLVLGYLSEQGVGFPRGERAASRAPLLQGCHILPYPASPLSKTQVSTPWFYFMQWGEVRGTLSSTKVLTPRCPLHHLCTDILAD